jgi:hypothetical protein
MFRSTPYLYMYERKRIFDLLIMNREYGESIKFQFHTFDCQVTRLSALLDSPHHGWDLALH